MTPLDEDNEADRVAAERYVRDVIARGRAAKPVEGELPLEATHELLDDNERDAPGDALPRNLRRRRFKLS
jgi:hypothetical protein